MPGPPEPPHDPRVTSGVRGRIQGRIYDNLKRIPGIVDVRFEESGTGVDRQLRGDVDTAVFAEGVIPVDDARIQANWWPQSDERRHWFQIHYADATGFDCGWHRQANAHVDGLDHYQERHSPDEAHVYEATTFEATAPVGLLWEVVDDRLVRRLLDRYRGDTG